jgi:hypothetical protein
MNLISYHQKKVAILYNKELINRNKIYKSEAGILLNIYLSLLLIKQKEHAFLIDSLMINFLIIKSD